MDTHDESSSDSGGEVLDETSVQTPAFLIAALEKITPRLVKVSGHQNTLCCFVFLLGARFQPLI